MASAARGPIHALLASSSGQWLVLGAGAVALIPDRVDKLLGTNFEKSVAAFFASPSSGSSDGGMAPIVIHTGGSAVNGGDSGVVTTIVKYGCGAGTIWVAYMVANQMLPEWAKDMLPVSRKFFDRAVTNLGKGILNVKDTLSKQILNLSSKQEDMSKQQEETHLEVINLSSELGEARQDLAGMNESLGRCEGQLENAERLQLYTSRGVKLLVRCVAGVLPGNDRIISELLQFQKEGEKIQKDSLNKQDKKSNNNTIEYTEMRKELMGLPATTTTMMTTTTAVPITPTKTIEEPTPPAVSPENEHPSRKDFSQENVDELLQLIREGKIQSMVHA